MYEWKFWAPKNVQPNKVSVVAIVMVWRACIFKEKTSNDVSDERRKCLF